MANFDIKLRIKGLLEQMVGLDEALAIANHFEIPKTVIRLENEQKKLKKEILELENELAHNN